MPAQINITRLKQNMEQLAGLGRKPSGGITRESFSEADRKVRAWIFEKIKMAGLQARIDAAGNVWGRLGSEGPVILAGSHLDTVPDGGMFDGALGVLAALECLQTIRGKGLSLNFPLELVAFSDEEGAFLSFLGSRAVTGTLSADELAAAKNMDDVPLQDAMAASGLKMQQIPLAQRDPHEVKAYLELHIEQGPRLDVDNIPIGIVQSIVGIVSYRITFEGEANHAGTTPLHLRRDAFLGAAEFSLRVHDWVRSFTSGVVTVGNADVFPGAFNIVPGQVRLALEFRDPSSQQLERMEITILNMGHEIAAQRNLRFNAARVSWDAPVRLSQRIVDTIEAEAKLLEFHYALMASGAGHDAQVMSQKADTGMIFIPSIDGKSHCPQEASDWNDIEKGTQLLLNCMLRLANEESLKR